VGKKQIAIAAAAATVAIGVGIGVSTFASFNSQRKVDGRAESGTLYLNNIGTAGVADWTNAGLAPKQVVEKSWIVTNNGSISGTSLSLGFGAYGKAGLLSTDSHYVADDVESAGGDEALSEGTITSNSELPANLKVKIYYHTMSGTTEGTTDNYVSGTADPTGTYTFADLAATYTDLTCTNAPDCTLAPVVAPSLTLTGGQSIKVYVKYLVKDAGNEIQGDAAALELTATLAQ